MNNAQLVALVVPIVLAQVSTIVVLIFGFITNNKRLEDMKDSSNQRFVEINKRLDDNNISMARRLDQIIEQLKRIEAKLDDHGERITRLEERTSPVRRSS